MVGPPERDKFLRWKQLESAPGSVKMNSVLKPRRIILTGLLAVLTGCSTGSRQEGRSPAGDREPGASSNRAPDQVEVVPESPRIAAPSASLPEMARPRGRNYAETWIALGRWSRERGCGVLRRISGGSEPSFSLSTGNGVFELQTGSRAANWDGVELFLGFTPQLIDGQPFVHQLDLKKNIEPLIEDSGPDLKSNGIIVIDPGHGGQNTGTVSVENGVFEKEYTLDWARRLEPLLASRGWQVWLTRTNDVDVPLSNRVAFAEEHQADLFISLHFNSAAPSQEQAGVETYCLTPAGMPSNLTRGYDDNVALVFPNNAFDAENLRYAVRLHRALLAVVGSDRGIRHARFLGVLRGQHRPAVLIEGGFLSNPREARQIADPAYRQELAEAVAAALSPSANDGKAALTSRTR
jgi:N-acetylmuramoyl-L-alanine amidase